MFIPGIREITLLRPGGIIGQCLRSSFCNVGSGIVATTEREGWIRCRWCAYLVYSILVMLNICQLDGVTSRRLSELISHQQDRASQYCVAVCEQ